MCHHPKQVYRQLGTNNRCHACLILLELGHLRMPARSAAAGLATNAAGPAQMSEKPGCPEHLSPESHEMAGCGV